MVSALSLVSHGFPRTQRRPSADLQPTGISSLDAMLEGGIPRGALIELCGSGSSGRTSLAFSLLAKATERQEVCAYVDVSDSLDPMSLAAAGVELQRLLWIRCGSSVGDSPQIRTSFSGGVSASPKQMQTDVSEHLENRNSKTQQGHMWQHPRDQIRGIETSLPGIFSEAKKTKAAVGNGHAATLAFPKLDEMSLIARCSGEQAEVRQSRRRQIQRGNESLDSEPAFYWNKGGRNGASSNKPWRRFDQALRATDLLLHSGGWGLVVFDLGNIPWVDARRIEMSTWFRFRRAIENTPTILLLVGEEPSAKSCSSLVLQCCRKRENWNKVSSLDQPDGMATLQGFDVEARVACSRTGLPPRESAHWKTNTLWTDDF